MNIRCFFQRNIPFWSSIGAGLEYYDFVVFAYLVPILSPVFFEGSEKGILAKTYLVSSIAYFARPLGSLVYGLLGDVRGRYKTFLFIMYTMAFSTFSIGCLPSFGTIGLTAPFLLFILRFLQGISFGAELPGAMIMICEHQQKNKVGKTCGLVISSVTFGSILASSVSLLLTLFYTEDEIKKWAWRLPFLVGGALGFVNILIRKNLAETPVFLSLQEKEKHRSLWGPANILLRNYKLDLLFGVLLGLCVSCLIITNTYFPRFFPKAYGYNPKEVFACITAGLLWSAFLTPILGRFGDQVGQKRLFLTSGILVLLLLIPFFSLLHYGRGGLLIFCLFFQTIISLCITTYFPLLVGIFPPTIRFTAVTVCYNATYALVSLLPIFFVSTGDFSRQFLQNSILICAILSLLGFSYFSKRKSISS